MQRLCLPVDEVLTGRLLTYPHKSSGVSFSQDGQDKINLLTRLAPWCPKVCHDLHKVNQLKLLFDIHLIVLKTMCVWDYYLGVAHIVIASQQFCEVLFQHDCCDHGAMLQYLYAVFAGRLGYSWRNVRPVIFSYVYAVEVRSAEECI